MKHEDIQQAVDQHEISRDSKVDAIAALVIVLCLAAMAVLWVSSQ